MKTIPSVISQLALLTIPICCLMITPTTEIFGQARDLGASKPASSQKLPASLQGAPEDVKAYYHVTDSLMRPTWHTRIHESWSAAERHKYAYLLYRANEYDPVTKRKFDLERLLPLRAAKTQDVIHDRQIIQMVESQDSKVLALLVEIPYWYSVVAEGIDTILYAPTDVKNAYIPGLILHARVTKVWKGMAFKMGDKIDGYTLSMWGCQTFKKGSTYIIAYSAMEKRETLKGAYLAIGGSEGCTKCLYPVQGGDVQDEGNIFGLGTTVKLQAFEDALRENIKTIASWKEVKVR